MHITPIKTRVLATLAALACAAGIGLGSSTSHAQAKYPSKPIQLVVPYPPGGSDVIARRLAVGMGEKLGQAIVVVNKPGASTQIGTQFVIQAQPDGHTLYVASVADLAAGPSLFKSLPFDALTELTPISYFADAPYILISASSAPYKTLAELAANAKASPDKVKIASYGVQSNTDIVARRFNMALGTTLTIVPYQGGTPAFNAIMRDEVQLLFPTTVASRPFIVNNQVRPYAVTTEARVPLYPDVPTLKEQGLDVVDGAGFGLMGPKGMPPEIVKTVHEALIAEMAKPEIKAFLNDLGLVILASTPEQFAATLRKMTAEWAELAAKLKLEKQ